MSSKPSPVLSGVQYLRGLAALLVVAGHASTMAQLPHYFQREVLDGFFRPGAIGVALFFVVSGFIMPYVTLAAGTATPLLSTGEFLRRRFTRIMPFLWVCATGYAALQFLGRGKLDIAAYLRTITLFPIGDLAPNVVWTLRHELLFYSLYALSLTPRSARWGQLLLVSWFLSPLLTWVFPLPAATAWPQQLLAFVINPVNLFFGAGFAIGHVYIRGRWPLHLSSPHGALGMLALCLLLVASQYGGTNLPPAHKWIWSPLSSLLFVAVLVSAFSMGQPSRPTRWHRAGLKLGEASYALYLTHTAVISACYGVLSRQDHTTLLLPSLIIVVTLACLASLALHQTVETPLIRLFNRWTAPPKAPPQDAAAGG